MQVTTLKHEIKCFPHLRTSIREQSFKSRASRGCSAESTPLQSTNSTHLNLLDISQVEQWQTMNMNPEPTRSATITPPSTILHPNSRTHKSLHIQPGHVTHNLSKLKYYTQQQRSCFITLTKLYFRR